MKKLVMALLFLPSLLQAEEFSFDLSGYKKKSFEWNADIFLTATHLQLDQDSTLYNLNFSDNSDTGSLSRLTAELELGAVYRFTEASFTFRGKLEAVNDELNEEQDSVIQAFYFSDKLNNNASYELGKRVLKWGKGYAWNPVAFAERAKDPNDPDLNREGYILATGDFTKTFINTDLKTLSITPLILPADKDINEDFGKDDDINFGMKLYMLYNDIDIDLMFLHGDSRGTRLGADFSTNITTDFEWHGELAFLQDQTIININDSNQLTRNETDYVQALIGIRYLTQSELTWIAEYYYNEGGYTDTELQRFYTLADANPITQATLFAVAQNALSSGFGRANPGQQYAYVRVSKKDVIGIVYLSAAFTSIINLDDASASLIPELIYTGNENIEIRGRLILLQGDDNTEFGEKANAAKLEVRLSYAF